MAVAAREALASADAAASLFSSLSLSRPAPATALPILAWDALNFLREFMDPGIMLSNPWRATRALEARVADFAASSNRAGYRVIAVVDADTGTKETAAKWRARRERELTNDSRNMLLGADVLLTDSLREHGIPVVRPLNADTDDVLAALAASSPSSAVLSQDGDMFRYTPKLTVFDGWTVVDGELVPTRAAASREAKGASSRSPRAADPQQAATALRDLDGANGAGSSAVRDKYVASAKGGRVARGTTSSSDRRRGSLHVLARPLRRAVYALLGEQTVAETFPVWCDGAAAWHNASVQPDDALVHLLRDARSAAAWLDEIDGDDGADVGWPQAEVSWRAAERRFSRRVLAAEMCAAAGGASCGSLLALMRTFDEYTAPGATPDEAERRAPRRVAFDATPKRVDTTPAILVACSGCGQSFGVTAGELDFFKMKGFDPPKRCKPCREKRKPRRA